CQARVRRIDRGRPARATGHLPFPYPAPAMKTGALATARERFDPPVLRARWTTEAALSAGELVAAIAARTGWDDALVERLLRHGGVHLDGRPHGGADLPACVAAGTRVDL